MREASSSYWVEGPRERLVERGPRALAHAEVVALLLGTGCAGEPVAVAAQSLLDDLGGLVGLSRAGVGELADRAGVGPVKAARIVAAIELGRRVASAAASASAPSFPDSRAVAAWARAHLAWLDHEELWVLSLDGRQRLRGARRVAVGGMHGLHVMARDPLRVALRDGASCFLLVHNHPSGDPAPSEEDISFTRRMVEASEVAGVPLVDHVIVTMREHTSMLDLGVLEKMGSQIEPRARLAGA